MAVGSAPAVYVITGASSGIGEATARRLAIDERGRSCSSHGARSASHGSPANSGRARAMWQLDLTDDDAPQLVRAHVLEHHDRLDLLVNNAGRLLARDFRRRGLGKRRAHDVAQLRRPGSAHRGSCCRCCVAALRARSSTSPRPPAAWRGRARGPTAPRSLRSPAGAMPSGRRSARTACTSGWCCRASSRRRVSRRPSCSPSHSPAGSSRRHEAAAEAIYDAGIGRRAERWVPRGYGLIAALRTVAPGLYRRLIAGGAGDTFMTATGADAADAQAQTAP